MNDKPNTRGEMATSEIDDGGWSRSAEAWITRMGEQGDAGRRCVLDPAMLARIEAGRFTRALDAGCGEGRFCRLLQGRGIHTTGVDPTLKLLERARELDAGGDYLLAAAERLPFIAGTFDLVVSYMALTDIADYRSAIAEMARVLAPNGALLIANLSAYQSAGMRVGWQRTQDGTPSHFAIDDYGQEWAHWVEWAGIRVRNWHRPLSAYMTALLDAGLTLAFFDEPLPQPGSADPFKLDVRVPSFCVMEWRKP